MGALKPPRVCLFTHHLSENHESPLPLIKQTPWKAPLMLQEVPIKAAKGGRKQKPNCIK